MKCQARQYQQQPHPEGQVYQACPRSIGSAASALCTPAHDDGDPTSMARAGRGTAVQLQAGCAGCRMHSGKAQDQQLVGGRGGGGGGGGRLGCAASNCCAQLCRQVRTGARVRGCIAHSCPCTTHHAPEPKGLTESPLLPPRPSALHHCSLSERRSTHQSRTWVPAQAHNRRTSSHSITPAQAPEIRLPRSGPRDR